MTFTNLAQVVCEPIVGTAATSDPLSPMINAAGFHGGILGGSWLTLSFVALAASLLALVLIYMVGNFLRNQQLLSWCKFEVYQVAGTVIIVVFSLAWVLGMCTFKLDFLNDDKSVPPINFTGMNMYVVADGYFEKLDWLGARLFGFMMYVSKIVTLLQKTTYYSSPMGLGVTDNPMDSFGQINSVLFFMVGGFVTSYLLNHMQALALQYMAYASLFYLYPFGIFFRSFEPTRAFGGALVGIAIGFFLFYPIAIGFNHYIMFSGLAKMDKSMEEANNNANNQVDNAPNEKNLGELQEDIRGDPANPAPTPQEQEKRSAGKIEDLVKGVGRGTVFLITPVTFYVMAAVILPVLNFVVLVEIIKGLTKLMGDELDVSNLTRLI